MSINKLNKSLNVADEINFSSKELRDYYLKFGKKRDLEQYFITQTYERTPPFDVDSLELAHDNSINRSFDEYNRRGRIGVRFEGQQSEKQSSPDIEIREIHGTESSPSPRVSLRSDTPALDVSPEQDIQECALNATSPGTLSASKKLEWDSLGDVGYDNARRGKEAQRQKQEYDKDGEIGSGEKLDYKVGKPTAHSTPQESSKLSLERKKSPEKSPRKPSGVHKNSGKYHLSCKFNRPSSFNFDVKKYYSFNVPTNDKSLYEETQQFHFDSTSMSPEMSERKRENIKVQKTDREVQATSNEKSVQTTHVEKVPQGIGNEDSNIDKGSPNVLSTAESFEYIPGPAYEKDLKNINDFLINNPHDRHETGRTLKSVDILKLLKDASSSQDVGPCIHKISKLLQSYKNDPTIIKKVVKKIGKILIQNNYPSDNETQTSGTTASKSSSPADDKLNSKSNTSEESSAEKCYRNPDSNVESQPMKCGDEDVKNDEKVFADIDDQTTVDNLIENDEIVEFVEEEGKLEKVDERRKVSFEGDESMEKNLEKVENSDRNTDDIQSEMETRTEAVQESNEFFSNVAKVPEQRDGSQSAPTVLSYAHYLKNKANENYGHSSKSNRTDRTSKPGKRKDAHNVLNVVQRSQRSNEDKVANMNAVAGVSGYRDNTQTVETISELTKINEEILKLTVLKLKLETKHRPDTLQVLQIDNNADGLIIGNQRVDKGASGDNKPAEEPVIIYYNTVASPGSDDYSTTVPPLNLENTSQSASSDEFEKDRSNVNSANSKQRPCCCCCATSSRSKPEPPKPECSCGKDGKSDDSQYPNVASKSSTSTGGSGFCACCRSRALCSQSSSGESCTNELRKYQKIYDKYQKCLTMKAFVKEYDELIEKYKVLREKRIAQCSTKQDDGNRSKYPEDERTYKDYSTDKRISKDDKDKSSRDYSEGKRISKDDTDKRSSRDYSQGKRISNDDTDKKSSRDYSQSKRISKDDTDKRSSRDYSQSKRISKDDTDKTSSRDYSQSKRISKDDTDKTSSRDYSEGKIISNYDTDKISSRDYSEGKRISKDDTDKRSSRDYSEGKIISNYDTDKISSRDYFEGERISKDDKDKGSSKDDYEDYLLGGKTVVDYSQNENVPLQKKQSIVSSRVSDATTCTNLEYKNADCGAKRKYISKGTSPLDTPGRPTKADVACQKCVSPNSVVISDQLINQVKKAFAEEYEDIKCRLENIKCNCQCMIKNVNVPSTGATSNIESARAARSEYSEGPLSGEEYIMISEESDQCKCVCGIKPYDKEKKASTRNGARISTTDSDEQTNCCNCGKRKKSKPKSVERSETEQSDVNARSKYSEQPATSARYSEKPSSSARYSEKPSSSARYSNEAASSSKHSDRPVKTRSRYSEDQELPGKYSGQPPTSPKRPSTYSDHSKTKSKQVEEKCCDKYTCKQSNNNECESDCKCRQCFEKQRQGENEQASGVAKSVPGGAASTYRKQRNGENIVEKGKSEMDLQKDFDKCCSKCGCRKKSKRGSSYQSQTTTATTSKSKSEKNQGLKSDDSVVMCLWCKAIPMDSACRICDHCLRKHQKYVENVIQRKKYICTSIPKAVAYNLIVESSESIIEETYQNEPKPLDNVFVKVAKIKDKRNEQRALRIEERYQDDKYSTDEQIYDMSSLNSDQNNTNGYKNGVRKSNKEHKQSRTQDDKSLRSSLEQNRPDFICNANCRQEILKKYNAIRRQRDAEQRKKLLSGVRSLPRINQDTLDHLEHIARECGLFLPKSRNKNNFNLFNSKEMIEETSRKYKKLPEIENKKISKRKQDYKKTNLVMASIFARKLQRKTLKGIVDISHSRQVISL